MKAVYPTLSHSTLLLIGLISMTMIIASVYSFASRLERDVASLELNYIADSFKNKLLEIYSLANQSSNYSDGTFQTSLPEKIGNRKYSVTLYSNGLTVNMSFKGETIEIDRQLKIEANLSGISYIPASIKMKKTQDGNVSIWLVE
jgi:hypothetical protein